MNQYSMSCHLTPASRPSISHDPHRYTVHRISPITSRHLLMAMFMYRCVEVRMIPMPSHECALTLRSKKAAERQTSTAITWRGDNYVTRTITCTGETIT